MTCAFYHHHPPSGDFYEPEAIEAFTPESMFYSEEGLSAAERAKLNLVSEYDDYYNDVYNDYLTDYYSELAEAYEAGIAPQPWRERAIE